MERIYGLDFKDFFSIVDNMYDELLIYDNNYNIIYINKACSRHYGLSPNQMIGKSFYDFVHANYWAPSVLPAVYKEKRAFAIRQSTYLGSELLTIAVPLFDNNNNIRFVVMNARDTVNEVELYNPQYISVKQVRESATVPVAKSSEMKHVLSLVERIAQLETPCIFTGESGSGKTVVAQYLHAISKRKENSLAIFDCSGMPDDRIRQELFGTAEMPGLLYRMRNGTLLLEKISELSLDTQSQLLQYLDSNYGASDGIHDCPRILASTDRDLKALISNGQFLDRLYYFLNIAEIYIPPLRKRREDIRPLIYHFMSYFCSRYNVNRHFTEGAIQAMIHAEWPLNVRELRYTIERLVVMGDSPVIDTDQLPKGLFGIVDTDETLSAATENFDERVTNFEASLIHDAYQKYGTSRKIAEHLGISQTRANNLIRKYIRSS